MNFQNKDGSPGIPELAWGEYGYRFFWCVSTLPICKTSVARLDFFLGSPVV